MMIKYVIHKSPIYTDTTIFKISTLDVLGKNLVYMLKEYGYTDLICRKYPLHVPELGITIKEYTHQICENKCK